MLKGQGSPDPDAMVHAANAFTEYAAYIHPVFDDRRATGNADDLVGVLCHADIDGDSLDDDSLVHETLLILIGGDETTRHVISGGVEELLAHPEQVARARRRPRGAHAGGGRGDAALGVTDQEHGPHRHPRHRARRAPRIRAGQEILLLYPSANRDEDVFEKADAFDITRSPNPHIAFGFGAHFCLGNQLARLELTVMVERVLARMPDLHLATERDHAGRGERPISSPGSRRCPSRSHPPPPSARAPSDGRQRVRRASPAGPSSSPVAAAASASPPPERLAADGAHVTICGRTEQKLVEATARIAAAAAGGATARYVVADVTVEEQVTAAVAATAAATGRIDGLFACAGGSAHIGSVLTADIDAVRATVDLNLTGLGDLREAGRRRPWQAQGGRHPSC